MYIYLHVPFCQSRCIYCDFYVQLAKYGGQDAFVEAVLKEIDLRFAELENYPKVLTTFYVGGGTPSLLPAKAYDRIINRLGRYLVISNTAEMTLEANPSCMKGSLKSYHKVGFNRVSVGVQSLVDRELKKLSRIHTAQEAKQFIKALQHAGFNNLSLDLMYGLPTQTKVSWKHTLTEVLKLNVQHISMYGLKVEKTTPLHKLVTMGAYPLPHENKTLSMYFEGVTTFAEAGFAQYEMSNFAKPGFASRHNLNYWNMGDFLALGPSAHGQWHGKRQENVADLKQYLEKPTQSKQIAYSVQEQLENQLIFGLRKTEGVHIPAWEKQFQMNFNQKYGWVVEKYSEYLEYETDWLRLKPKAIPVSNTILAEFIEV